MASTMGHRERVLKALNHQQPDRVPMDFGGTLVSGIHRLPYEQLVKYLGVEVGELYIPDTMQQIAQPDEKVMELLDVDFRALIPGAPDNNIEVFLDDGLWIDEWSVLRRKPEGACYYDMIKSPLEGDNITAKDIDKFHWPDPLDPGRWRGLREQAEHLRNNTDYAITLNYAAVFVHISQYLRGFIGWYEDLILEPERICYLFDRILDFYLKVGEKLFAEVGEYIDVVVCADDISGQNGPLISPKLYRELIKPRQAKLFDFIHKNTNAKLLYHTCGTALPFLEDLIEIGMDILNPVQVAAKDMDTRMLKEKFGDRISFWGAIDTQRVLPFGTEEDVKKEVEKRILELGKDGGYVLNSVHNIQPGVRPENIVTMFKHAKEFSQNRK